MRGKKGVAVSFYIVLGILILLLSSFYLILLNNQNKVKLPLLSDRASINKFLEECLIEASEEALKVSGLQGGYLAQEEKIIGPYFDVSYHSRQEQSLVPTIAYLEQSLSFLIEEKFQVCVDEFRGFTQQGWDVGAVINGVETKIDPAGVTVLLNIPGVFTYQENTISFEAIQTLIPLQLWRIKRIAQRDVLYAVNETRDNVVVLRGLQSHKILPPGSALINRELGG